MSRPFWTQRHAELPFYTLGAANYYDISDSASQLAHASYRRKAEKFNAAIEDSLGWLFERLAYALSLVLRAPVQYPGCEWDDMHRSYRTTHPSLSVVREWGIVVSNQERSCYLSHCWWTPELLGMPQNLNEEGWRRGRGPSAAGDVTVGIRNAMHHYTAVHSDNQAYHCA